MSKKTIVCFLPVLVAFTLLFPAISSVWAQTDSKPVAPIILFLHGWCGASDVWDILEPSLAQSLNSRFPDLYDSAPKTYVSFFDGTDVWFQRLYSDGTVGWAQRSADPDARFFRLAFIPDDY